jgi:Ricin-type beta-trefoil lectin domain
MRQRRWVTAAIASITALLATGGLLGMSAPAAVAGPAAATSHAVSNSSIAFPDLVSQTPVKWTPNVFTGSPSCNPQWFGPGNRLCKHHTIYSQAVVNGEVVVVGAFTQACQTGPAASGHCAPGTLVTRDDIFAYQLGTGIIDPDFAPVLDQGPVYTVVAGPDNTVYVGGSFTTVNGVSEPGLVQLSVTPGQSTDGQVVPGFAAPLSGTVHSLALGGDSLYVGGNFRTLIKNGIPKEKGIARLDATTGFPDGTFTFTLGDPIPKDALQVEYMSLTPDENTLIIGGTFLQVNGLNIPRVALLATGGGLGATGTLDNWSAPVLANGCSSEHDEIRSIDSSPDGSYFVVATTGYRSAGGASICDAAARFETGATGTNVQPTWVNYAGGDSLYAVAVSGSAVYIGGHNRFINNECGNNFVCEANAVLVNGLTALDPNTGLALPWWHPQTSRGYGVDSLVLYPAGSYAGSNGGLLVGTNVNSIGGVYHAQNAIFPLTATAPRVPGGPIMSGIFSQGRLGGLDETTNGIAAMCVDDAGNSSTPGATVQLTTCQNDAEQNWVAEPGGTIQINGLCLDTQGGGTAPGTYVVLGTCNATGTQSWSQGAASSLVNQASGLCLDDPGASTTNNTPLQIATCTGSIEQAWPLPAAPSSPAPPPVGSVYPTEEQHNGNVPCLDNAGGAAIAGSKVVLVACVGSKPQQWTMEADGTFQNFGMCLDTANGGTSQGTLTVLNTCNGGNSQVWTPGPNGSRVNAASRLCLDDPNFNTANNVQMQIYSCNGGNNQRCWLPEL